MFCRRIACAAIFLAIFEFEFSFGYSALEDERIIKEYKRNLTLNAPQPLHDPNHAHVVRRLVNGASWASVATISTNKSTNGFPMATILSVNDKNAGGQSTGRIQFLLTPSDFAGADLIYNNKTTFLFSDEQNHLCTKPMWPDKPIDPMDPTCGRAMISGEVRKLDKNSNEYDAAIVAFVYRHPAATKWMQAKTYYLYELDIKSIFVWDSEDGPHNVETFDYYNAQLK